MVLKLPKGPFPRKLSLLDQSHGLSLFDRTQNSLCTNSLFSGVFVKNNQWHCFTWQLFELLIASWSYEETKQNINMEKLGHEMSTEGFEKLQWILENLEAHMQGQG